MKSFRSRSAMLGVPAVMSLLLAVACGGSDDDNDGGKGGSDNGQTNGGSSSGGSSSSAGSSSKAGGSSAGSSSGGSGNTAGSSSSGGGDFSTGLPGTKPLSDLTPDEVDQLCDDLDGFYSGGPTMNVNEFTCRLAGLFGAAFTAPETDEAAQAACQAAYDDCIAEPDTSSPVECTAPGDDCTATVAELEACTNDSAEFFAGLQDSFPACEDLTLADLEDGGGFGDTPMAPDSCSTFEMKCPGGPVPSSDM